MNTSRSVVRRHPAPGRPRTRNVFGYGVGHRGGGSRGLSLPGPASHPHVAAIEVALFHPAVGEVSYTLMGMYVPIHEVLETFLDDAGLNSNRDDYALLYQGQIIAKEATSRSLHLDPFDDWPVAVFEVSEVGTTRMKAQLNKMNKIGAALRISRNGFDTQHSHLIDVDSLSQIFSFLDLDDLISVTRTCVLWHNVSQRLSLILQLKCSALPDVEYPLYLNLMAEFSNRLELGMCKARIEESRQWSKLGMRKEQPGRLRWDHWSRRWGRPHMFTKAAGCTTMRTVQTTCPIEELQQRMLPLHSPHVGFAVPSSNEEERSQLRMQIEEHSRREFDETKIPAVETMADVSAASSAMNKASQVPPEVIRESSPELRHVSVGLFRSYFSPSMHFIFPLIANQQALNGLDFHSTQTWGVRHGGSKIPIGAVAWRIREPLIPSIGAENASMSTPSSHAARFPTMPVLEVLFIAVWEKYRHADCGGVLVSALEDEARSRGCGYMYVEIGHEQPKARNFWGGHGFVSSREAGVSKEQSLFFDYSCLRFADTEQFVKSLCQH